MNEHRSLAKQFWQIMKTSYSRDQLLHLRAYADAMQESQFEINALRNDMHDAFWSDGTPIPNEVEESE